MKKVNKVERILVERDEITQNEAQRKIAEVREMIAEADPWDIEDILADELGLELDYIFDIIM